MTFKEMVFKGLCDGTVKIISNPNDDCIACQIGEFWFYFIGSEDEDLTPDECKAFRAVIKMLKGEQL